MKKVLLFTAFIVQGTKIFALIDSTPIMPNMIEVSVTEDQMEAPSIKLAPMPNITTSPLSPMQNGADRMIAFKRMEEKHRTDWLNLEQKYHSLKYDMMKKHHSEWVDFGTQKIGSLNAMNSWTQKDKDAFFDAQLKKAIVLHKKQVAEWKQLCDQRSQEAKNIYNRHQQELADFEKRANLK